MERDIIHLLLEWVRGRYFGKYRGKVVDNQDETQRARLLVTVPAVLGKLTVWAMPCVPYAGEGVGFLSLPNKDAGVWVEFEGGDPSFPIWVGGFWADREAPEQARPEIKTWRTEKLSLRLDDNATELKIATDDAASVTLTTEVVTEAGESKHSVGAEGVTSESGETKTEVSAASFTVNDGAFEVT